MIRRSHRCRSAAVMCVAAAAQPAAAQFGARPQRRCASGGGDSAGEHCGVVLDEHGQAARRRRCLGARLDHGLRRVGSPRAGSRSATCRTARISFARICRDTCRLARGSIQVDRATPRSRAIVLTRRADADVPVPVLAAGVGPPAVIRRRTPAEPDGDDARSWRGAWRLRHVKRSVLKDAGYGRVAATDDGRFVMDDSFDSAGTRGGHARAACDVAVRRRAAGTARSTC